MRGATNFSGELIMYYKSRRKTKIGECMTSFSKTREKTKQETNIAMCFIRFKKIKAVSLGARDGFTKHIIYKRFDRFSL